MEDETGIIDDEQKINISPLREVDGGYTDMKSPLEIDTNLDDTLEKVGFGPYQIRIMATIILPACFFNGLLQFPIIFISGDGVDCAQIEEFSANGEDYSNFSRSLASDFSVGCDKMFFYPLMYSLGGLSAMIGTITLGYVSDIYGRSRTFFISGLLIYIFGILRNISWNLYVFSILNMLHMFPLVANYQIPAALAMEWSTSKHRTTVVLILGCSYSLGIAALPGFAYFLDYRWTYLSLTTCIIPLFLSIIGWWSVPESPRWLLINNLPELDRVMLRANRVNRNAVGTSILTSLRQVISVSNGKKSCRELESKGTWGELKYEVSRWMTLFKHKRICYITIVVTVIWFCDLSMYFGLFYYTPKLHENPYLSFFLAACVELPTYFVS